MKWQDIGGFFKKRNRSRTLWVSTGTLGIFGVLAMIMMLTGVSTTYTGDIVCGEECVVYVNVTSTYWRICFADDFELVQTIPEVDVETYVPARGKGNWRLFDPTKDCIERKNKYNYLPNRFKIIGHKEPEQTVKWSVDKFDVDPLWIGTPTNETPINETPEYNQTYEWWYHPENKTWIIAPKDDFRGGGNDDEETTLNQEEKSKGFIDYSGASIEFRVKNKTGLEEHLDIEINTLNDTATEFCIETNEHYKRETNKTNDIKKVPLEKLKLKNSFSIKKFALDLNNDECFVVSYDNLTLGIEFKIGWNSVIIDISDDISITQINSNENIIKDSNGILHVAYEGSGSDLWYANSSDNGLSWTKKELLNGFAGWVGIVEDSNDNLLVYYVDIIANPDAVKMFNSTDGGNNWIGPTVMFQPGASSIHRTSCITDSNDIFQCCILDNTNDALYYGNSSGWNDTLTLVNGNSVDDTDSCDIEVDNNNCIYIVGYGTDETDIDIWSPCLNGWGDGNRIQIDPNGGSFPTIAIDKDNNIHTAWGAASDLWYGNSSDGGSTWTTQEIDSDSSSNVEIVVSENKDIHILYRSSSSPFPLLYSNSTNNGLSWTVRTQLSPSSLWPSIAQTRYPISNRLTDTLRYVYGNLTNYLLYDNFTVPFTPPPDTTPPSFSNNQTNATATTPTNGTDVQLNLTITDATLVNSYRLTHNDTIGGNFVNETIILTGDISPATSIFNYSIENFPKTGGTMGWQVWANDTSGNSNVSIIYTFTVQIIVDTTSPIISNLRNTSTTNSSSFIEWSTDDNANYTIQIFNNSDRDLSNLFDIRLNSTSKTSHNPFWDNLSNSTTYWINLSVVNSVGNITINNTFNFTTAKTTPPPDITNPKSNISINNTSPTINDIITISMNVSDETGLSSCIFFNNMSNKNSSPISLSGTSDHTSCFNITTINISQVQDILFRGYVNDTSNNWNFSDIVITIKDTTAPIISGLKNTSTSNDSSVITWTTNENTNYTLLWYNTSILIGNINVTTFATSYNPTITNLIPNTTYFINLTVWDSSGNTAINNTFNFTTALIFVPPISSLISNVDSCYDNISLGGCFAVNMSLAYDQINWSDNITIHSGNYFWNFTELNILPINTWLFNFTNNGATNITVTMRLNTSNPTLWQLFFNNSVNISNSSFVSLINLTINESRLINLSLDLHNISETYVNWTLNKSNAEFSFNYTINITSF